MERRSFIKNTTLCAIAVSATGFVRFDGKNYTGDCATTTDIIGPFYRPNAPVRSDMLIPGDEGEIVELSGVIKHKDCSTPLKGACVELWHCDAKGAYDNDSDQFRYRSRTYCDDDGRYKFRTIFPVAYGIGNGMYRPAHYHLLISAKGYQELVTQIYFAGDPRLSEDASSASPAAKSRILEKQKKPDGELAIVFNVTMMENLPADPTVIDMLTGIYIDANNSQDRHELFQRDGLLWLKDNTPTGGNPFYYAGNNTFNMYGGDASMHFELLSDGNIKATASRMDNDGKRQEQVSMKQKQ